MAYHSVNPYDGKIVNNISWLDAELPFGGIEDSSYGRELVRFGAIEAPPTLVGSAS